MWRLVHGVAQKYLRRRPPAAAGSARLPLAFLTAFARLFRVTAFAWARRRTGFGGALDPQLVYLLLQAIALAGRAWADTELGR